MEKFEQLGLSPEILRKIKEAHFDEPSEIQAKTIPLVLKGKDVIAGSATGSGKTLAFAAPIIQKAKRGKGIQALVLTPTRELAEQVSREFKKFSHFCPINIVPVYGGVSINPQIDNLRTADVVVGTPGRILDHLQRGTINLKNIEFFVLDEADRMLDMGFIVDVEKIMKACSTKHQTFLFSATISTEIANLAKKYMHEPIRVDVDSYVDPSKLKQVYYNVDDNLKFSLLVHFLKSERSGLAMVFCNTQRSTDFVADNLKKAGIKAIAIHGGLSQNRRTTTLQKFHANDFHVLVCTDVAARGLDIKGVSHVYNYNIPKESKQYVHRIGRTARAGKEGIAVNLLSSREHDNFTRVLKENSVKIEKVETPYVERVVLKDIGGFRKSHFDKNKVREEKEKRRFGRGDERPERPNHTSSRFARKADKVRKDNAENSHKKLVRRGWA